ncbi:MAG: metallophosphoesterase [Actinomycetota bacterium]|nr:metallophosphoesterase [Actinomycetota bacterium]
MRVAVITDTHWSARKSSRLFQDYFEQFYNNVFFPTLEQYGIDTIIHMGDAFDSRKSIDFVGLDWTRKVALEPLSKYKVHLITGNHDVYFKNSNKVNSPELLLKDYGNITTYSEPTEVNIGGLNILLLPWINSENQDKSFKLIKNTKAKVVMGHLELQGFRVNKNLVMEEHGLEANLFSNFKKVFSGHYHTRSDNGTVFYLGNPYEIYWSDVNDTRGFTIFNTETLEHFHIDNPYRMFYNIYYEDTPYQTFDVREYENKIVRVIVRKKSDIKQFERFIDKLYNANIAELKVVENFAIEVSEDFEAFESEDTISVLNRYIEEAEVNLDKSILQKMLGEIYQEACEIV